MRAAAAPRLHHPAKLLYRFPHGRVCHRAARMLGGRGSEGRSDAALPAGLRGQQATDTEEAAWGSQREGVSCGSCCEEGRSSGERLSVIFS
ncbi:hypothetical protein E2C01_101160 [Portunus trituberculatus]|uniref:Uncharacterized protein n=1 Tax=Portunus trituberculatus TaxID=210409 RepID=A0A5B7KE20_PORTR|nr:hypothetical protein [Portunus trituberculatus]